MISFSRISKQYGRQMLFVDAWRTRLDEPAKQRPGDEMPWDAPGFEPPDPMYHDSG